ncbi:vitelline membrane outer layer protein 1-like [Paroedura picta]|uniref:vitelline membrane outer layer protein 1-like n=1 Tax=Paroedura picta TaxID=143630 RepID=UPI004056487C
MPFTIVSAFSLPLLWYLWGVEARLYNAVLTVPNGGGYGTWGSREFCRKGYANSFALKVQKYLGPIGDDTSLNTIRLFCSDGSSITSYDGPYGEWSNKRNCKSGFLNSFALRVTPPQGLSDDTAADNIMFTCTDGTEVEGNGHDWGSYGEWRSDS